jgi:hypothetical protein
MQAAPSRASAALQTLLAELQPPTNGALRRAGSGRVFAEVTALQRIRRAGKADFVRGTARCHQLRINVAFDTYAVAAAPMHVGPVSLPPVDATALHGRRGRSAVAPSVLYGDVSVTRDGYRFTCCTEATPLFFFFQHAYRPLDFLQKNADALQTAGPGRDDLCALAALLHCGFDLILDPLRKATARPTPVALSFPPADFVILTCLLIRDAQLYGQFLTIVKRRRAQLDPHRVQRLLNGAVPTQALRAFIDSHVTERLQAFSRPQQAQAPTGTTKHCGETRQESSESELSC